MGLFERFKKKNSGDAAKERLKLLLVSDRANCSPDVMEKMGYAGMNVASMDMEMCGAMAAHADLKNCPSCTALDVANVLLFLASDESKPITGQTIVCDYGANL